VSARPRLSGAVLAALGVFAVALAVRLLWVAYVDNPFDNIFSDMGGYIDRARQAAYGRGDPYPIFATLYPPGAHLVYAAEMKLVGFDHHGPMLLLNCLWGAAVAPCAMLMATRIEKRLAIPVLVGLFMAVWYPVLAFAGFFSSEQPFAGAIAVSAWLLVRQVDTGKSAVSLGIASAVAYLIRPQVVMTLFALTLLGLVIVFREPLQRFFAFLKRLPETPRLRVGRLVIAGSILTAAVVFGAVRYHSLCGRWGLISDNSAMTRLWADTNYGKVRSKQGFFFASPPKNETGEQRELLVDGYVGDPAVLDQARRNEVHYMTLGERVVRWVRNVRFLFFDNALWPESMHQGDGWRLKTYNATRRLLLYALCPLALLGMIRSVRRPTLMPVVCTAHVLTMLFVAAFFFAEQRYRVPYDIFIVLLALEGGTWVESWLTRGLARLSRRFRRPIARSS